MNHRKTVTAFAFNRDSAFVQIFFAIIINIFCRKTTVDKSSGDF